MKPIENSKRTRTTEEQRLVRRIVIEFDIEEQEKSVEIYAVTAEVADGETRIIEELPPMCFSNLPIFTSALAAKLVKSASTAMDERYQVQIDDLKADVVALKKGSASDKDKAEVLKQLRLRICELARHRGDDGQRVLTEAESAE